MNISTKKLFAICALILVLIVCFYFFGHGSISGVPSYNFSEPIILGTTPLFVDRVTTRAGWEQGLSGQQPLSSSEGLLFVFDKPDMYSIWMKDMNFPIDVFWFDKNGTVIMIRKNFLPSSYPEIATPTLQALYVLETSAGLADNDDIQIGDSLNFLENSQ